MHRRSFLQQATTLLGSYALFNSACSSLATQPIKAKSEKKFWQKIRNSFQHDPKIINLNNAGLSPTPIPVMDAFFAFEKKANVIPTVHMWRKMRPLRELLRAEIANFAGVVPDEIAFNRNATEGLNNIVFGLPLEAGDEVVLSKYAYPHVIHAWRQRAARDKIKLVWVDIELPSVDNQYLTKIFTEKFSDRTKLVMITHIVNWTGQKLPVRAIADVAKAKGIEVLVDGAQSFGQLDFKIKDLNCDYFATSLHKWLMAPIGSGFLWMRKEHIGKIFPLNSSNPNIKQDIRKFEDVGTYSIARVLAIGKALDFHKMIGSARKLKRLRFIQNYWINQVKNLDRVQFVNPIAEQWLTGLAVCKIKDVNNKDFYETLQRADLHVSLMNWEQISGVRISPSIYTTEEELDTLVKQITLVAQKELILNIPTCFFPYRDG